MINGLIRIEKIKQKESKDEVYNNLLLTQMIHMYRHGKSLLLSRIIRGLRDGNVSKDSLIFIQAEKEVNHLIGEA